MDYTTEVIKSASGLTQQKALLALQKNRHFKPGTKIASFYNQGGHWVAKLLVPKTAANPFEETEEDVKESPAELHDKEHDEHEKSESPFEEHEEHEKSEKSEKHEDSEAKKIKELEKKIDLLLDALGISEKGKNLDEKPEEPSADLPAAPSKGGPADSPKKSDPLPPGSGAKLKPGEVPNKPGMTPVGAPAFASVQAAASSPPGQQSPAGGPSMAPPVGAPTINTSDDILAEQQQGMARATENPSQPLPPSQILSFTASRLDPDHELSIRQAKFSIENELSTAGQGQNFRVARIKREGDYIHALVTRNDS